MLWAEADELFSFVCWIMLVIDIVDGLKIVSGRPSLSFDNVYLVAAYQSKMYDLIGLFGVYPY